MLDIMLVVLFCILGVVIGQATKAESIAADCVATKAIIVNNVRFDCTVAPGQDLTWKPSKP